MYRNKLWSATRDKTLNPKLLSQSFISKTQIFHIQPELHPLKNTITASINNSLLKFFTYKINTILFSFLNPNSQKPQEYRKMREVLLGALFLVRNGAILLT